jgi:hypothetical protein
MALVEGHEQLSKQVTNMTKSVIWMSGAMLILLLATSFVWLREPSEKRESFSDDTMEKVNLNLNDKSAAQLAEIIFLQVYGEDVLKERPWNVTRHGDFFTIEGTLHAELGGVATMKMCRFNAEVVSITHYK